MLLNDFYTIHNLKTENQKIFCTIHFNAAHNIFKGHFPQQPVVPGVCMMQMIKEILTQETGKNILLQQAPQVKFLQLILPDVLPVAEIGWKENGEKLIVNALFKKDTTVLFKMQGDFIIN